MRILVHVGKRVNTVYLKHLGFAHTTVLFTVRESIFSAVNNTVSNALWFCIVLQQNSLNGAARYFFVFGCRCGAFGLFYKTTPV
jgi:hypothetical protein